jgi:putative Mg2+ transporter-C (MgtC) family protein
VTDLTAVQELVRLSSAAGLGAAVGLERELRAQPAGLRTHLLVALGSSLFTVAGITLPGTDPGRVAAQVVAGIGFLGAGAILRDRGGVHGLTTAASLWVSAATGLACGIGRTGLAAFATVLAVLALAGVRFLERGVFPRSRGHRIVLDVADGTDLRALVAAAGEALGAPVHALRLEHVGDRSSLVLSSPLQRHFSVVDLAMRLRAVDGVAGVELGSARRS